MILSFNKSWGCMSSFVTRISEPFYYHREYTNDVPKSSDHDDTNTWVNTTKRMSLTALPFLSLYKPLAFPLSIVMGGLRTVTSTSQLMDSIKTGKVQDIGFAMLHTSVSMATLAGTVFAHPLGMFVSTAQDLVLESTQLVHHLNSGDHKKAMESCLSIINSALYLALFSHGGLEIAIASLAMQILVGLNQSYAEFSNGRYIEGTGCLLMSMVRGGQLAGQINTYQMRSDFRRHVNNFIENPDSFQERTLTADESVFFDGGTTQLREVTCKISRSYPIKDMDYCILIAEYSNGTRVYSCLNEPMNGFQSIYRDDRKVAESWNIKWYDDHFVHQYSNGTITTYPNKQVAELHDFYITE
jgi:hypothetical protein